MLALICIYDWILIQRSNILACTLASKPCLYISCCQTEYTVIQCDTVQAKGKPAWSTVGTENGDKTDDGPKKLHLGRD
jgi:hypothetical protein